MRSGALQGPRFAPPCRPTASSADGAAAAATSTAVTPLLLVTATRASKRTDVGLASGVATGYASEAPIVADFEVGRVPRSQLAALLRRQPQHQDSRPHCQHCHYRRVDSAEAPLGGNSPYNRHGRGVNNSPGLTVNHHCEDDREATHQPACGCNASTLQASLKCGCDASKATGKARVPSHPAASAAASASSAPGSPSPSHGWQGGLSHWVEDTPRGGGWRQERARKVHPRSPLLQSPRRPPQKKTTDASGVAKLWDGPELGLWKESKEGNIEEAARVEECTSLRKGKEGVTSVMGAVGFGSFTATGWKLLRRGVRDHVLRCAYSNVRERYALHKDELGSGQYGVIRQCMDVKTGRVYACKTIKKEGIRVSPSRWRT